MSEQPIHAELEFDLIDRLNKALRVSGKATGTLASDLDVHRNTISNYLHGRTRPDRRTLIAWSLATGVPLEWLERGTISGGNGGPGSSTQPTDYRDLGSDNNVITLRRVA